MEDGEKGQEGEISELHLSGQIPLQNWLLARLDLNFYI